MHDMQKKMDICIMLLIIMCQLLKRITKFEMEMMGWSPWRYL